MALATARTRSLALPVVVLVHAHPGDEPDALLVAATHLGPEHAGRHEADVAVGVEAVERERVAAGHDDKCIRPSAPAAGSGMASSGAEQARTSASDAASRSNAAKPSAWRLLAGGVGPHAGHHLEPRVPQVEGPRATLVAVADDGDLGAL